MATDLSTFDEFLNLGQSVQKMNLRLIEAIQVAPTAVTVNNGTPAPGEITTSQLLGFDVTCADSEIATVLVWVHFKELHTTELAYDGNGFTEQFSGTVTGITDGLRFSFKRTSGWIASPKVSVKAISVDGGTN